MFARAGDIARAGVNTSTVKIDGIKKPVLIRGLTQAQVSALGEISRNPESAGAVNAWLIKQCCPAFRWWSMNKIHNKLPVPVVVVLVKEIVRVSGLGKDAVEDAAKN